MRNIVIFTIIAISPMVSACGHAGYKFEPEIVPYYLAFKKDTGIDMPIQFEFSDVIISNGSEAAGICYPYLNKVPKIFISKKVWTRISDITRKLLIYHELGHCLLDMEHVTNRYHIMNPYLYYNFTNGQFEGLKRNFVREIKE